MNRQELVGLLAGLANTPAPASAAGNSAQALNAVSAVLAKVQTTQLGGQLREKIVTELQNITNNGGSNL